MEKVKSKDYDEAQIKLARAHYETYLTANCSKEAIIKILSRHIMDYFPDDLCIAHLKK